MYDWALIKYHIENRQVVVWRPSCAATRRKACLLYTSDAADDLIGVDLGCPRIINKQIVTYADD